ncbi:hypothetical protein BJ138DRAFT_1147204 [Hygrophoropsis aurantiaca]|uniref:Uncharacterized protein n=1 Tax=Hygrophoropsis aurantiaca TaxID=72124 RepID=A0ACB8AIX0_9AGAM|nr:hypothetical protein BJ138DRAFT_1147204 [Hygrophoropsis aurantiaca]
MGEVVNAIVAFAVIVIIFRWATSSSNSNASPNARSAISALGFRPKNVTQEMVDQIHSMFPDIPPDNIRFDLLRTGSIELTSNKILERGFLDAPPPAYYTLYPRQEAPHTPGPAPIPTPAQIAAKESLIARYKLQERVSASGSSSSVSGGESGDASVDIDVGGSGGKAKWEDTAEKREASLRERKAQMILAARQRLLAQQQAQTQSTS